jgi:hypothetical protein
LKGGENYALTGLGYRKGIRIWFSLDHYADEALMIILAYFSVILTGRTQTSEYSQYCPHTPFSGKKKT